MRVRRLFVLVAAAALALGISVPTTQSAEASNVYLICWDKGSGNCIDLYQGNSSSGTKIIEWPYNSGDRAEQWILESVGTVDGYTCTPFDNCTYDRNNSGDTIYKIRYAHNTSMCLQNDGNHGGAVLEPCSGSWGVNWVAEGFSFVNIYLTNQRGSQQFLTAKGSKGYQLYCGEWLQGYSQWLEWSV